MKRDRSKNHLTKADYEKFSDHDTRYFGLFYKSGEIGNTVKVDPKRMQKVTGVAFSEDQLKIIAQRKTHYFYPKKTDYFDYCCNTFHRELQSILEYWESHYKDLIQYALKKIKQPSEKTAGNCSLFMCGVLDFDEAQTWANTENYKNARNYQAECDLTVRSLYAQFIHQMASRIEAATVSVLTKNNAMEERFDRNILYATAAGKKAKVTELPSFQSYDELYCLWNFIKHNSKSTYEKLKTNFPDVVNSNSDYQQGEIAYLFLNFSDELILNLINGCDSFFKEYCYLVFDEDFEEAQWNYGKYFLNIAAEARENILNPMGFSWYL